MRIEEEEEERVEEEELSHQRRSRNRTATSQPEFLSQKWEDSKRRALERKSKTDKVQQDRKGREYRMEELKSKGSALNRIDYDEAKRDKKRLLRKTHATKKREFSNQELDERNKRREETGAHQRSIHNTLIDRQWQGRAVPMWRKVA